MEQPKNIEQHEQFENPYKDSSLLEKVSRSKAVAFFDIDSTLTGDPAVATEIRKQLAEHEWPVALVTSRTEEMVMTDADRKRIAEDELQRPEPHMKKGDDGRMEYADPASLPEQQPFMEADVVAGTTGSRIFIRQKDGGYKLDTEFEKSMNEDSVTWRAGVSELLAHIDPEHKIVLAPIDEPGTYEANLVDVYPPNYRVQLEFGGDLNAKQAFTEKIGNLKHNSTLPEQLQTVIQNIRLTDDSNPAKNRYTLYVTPNQGYKARAVEQVIKKIVAETGVAKQDLQLVIAGDSFPDVAMGLYSGAGTKATFIVPGGSRLAEAFTEPATTKFAGESMAAIKNRLVGEPEKGMLTFKQPLYGDRKVIVGDQAFPGSSAPQSVLEALKTLL